MLTAKHASCPTHMLTIARVALVRLLDRARCIVQTRTVKPIYAAVRLEAANGILRLRATDGELSPVTHMPVEGDLPPCVVPLAELLRRVKAAQHRLCSLTLSADGQQLVLNGGSMGHTLQTLPVDEFPPVSDNPAGRSVTVDAAELVSGLRIAVRAVAREPSRYSLDGILLESDAAGTRLVATDGRRLVVVELPVVARTITGQVILPGRLVRVIEKLTTRQAGSIVLAVARPTSEPGEGLPGRVFTAGPAWVLSTDEPEGRFPRYADVMPRSHSRFAITRSALAESLAEVALAVNDEARIVRVDLSPTQLRLSASTTGVSAASATLPARFLGGGDAVIHTAFNPAYLLDAVRSLTGDTVVIDVEQNGCGYDHKVFGKPAMLHAEHDPATRWVIMPVSADLPPTRENLGSNFKPEYADAS